MFEASQECWAPGGKMAVYKHTRDKGHEETGFEAWVLIHARVKGRSQRSEEELTG